MISVELALNIRVGRNDYVELTRAVKLPAVPAVGAYVQWAEEAVFRPVEKVLFGLDGRVRVVLHGGMRVNTDAELEPWLGSGWTQNYRGHTTTARERLNRMR